MTKEIKLLNVLTLDSDFTNHWINLYLPERVCEQNSFLTILLHFRSEVCVPALRQPYLWDGGRRRLLEFCDVDWWEGGDTQILPVTFWDEGPGLLLQLPKCLQEELLLHRLLQQWDAAPTSRYSQRAAFELMQAHLYLWGVFYCILMNVFWWRPVSISILPVGGVKKYIIKRSPWTVNVNIAM